MRRFLMVLMLFVAGQALLAQENPSLFTDIKGLQVGDILAVIIVEATDAARGSSEKNAANSENNLGGSVGGDLFGTSAQLGLSSSSSSSFRGSEGTEQSEQLRGRISVRIVEVTDNGLFRIEGERKTVVNGRANTMKLSGFVRPRDIRTNNTVLSYHVAEAQITYNKPGLGNKLGNGFFSKLVTPLFAGVLLAAAFGALSFQ